MTPGVGGDARPSPGERVIGIDLGMTSVVTAFVATPGQPPTVIPAEKGLPTFPSVVAFKDGGRPVIGRAAQDMLTTAPSQSIAGIKRLLGRKAKSQAVRDLVARMGFEVSEGKNGEALIKIADREVRVPEVAGILLDHVRKQAEIHLGEPVRNCVIAVPAYFNDTQKAAVREAAELAGLKAKKLVHEPTAVALAYGYNRAAEARVVIVDMGGVRLDVSVMEIAGNVFDVVATGGDPYLGGANVDARVAEWILSSIKRRYGRDLAQHPRLLQKVRTAAEQAKRELARCRAVDLQIPLSVGTKDAKAKLGMLRLHAATLEELADNVVSRVLETIRRTLADRGLKISDVDDVILVGGGTRLPLLRRRIETFFGKEARASLPPEEVVSLGAALLGESLRKERPTPVDIVKEPIGISLADGRYMKIIDKDSKLPITRRVMIPTVHDNQRILELDIFEGEAEDILGTEYLGTIVYRGIEPAKAGEARVIVDMTLTPERVLSVSSPEPGREGEVFEFKAHGNRRRSEREFRPVLNVANHIPLSGKGEEKSRIKPGSRTADETR